MTHPTMDIALNENINANEVESDTLVSYTSLQEQCLQHIIAQHWKLAKNLLSSPKFGDEVSMAPLHVPATLLHVVCSIPSVPEEIIFIILRLYPQACRMEDEDGNLPIHLLCSTFFIRPELIKLLLNVCPESSFQPSYEGQELPFYMLINYCLQNDGLQSACELISSLPSSLIYNEYTSVLHQVCNGLLPQAICHELIEQYPEICKIHNNGNTLLHIMCSHEQSTATLIRHIIMIFPEACTVRDDDGNLPLHIVNSQQHSLEIIRMLMQCYPQALLVQNSSAHIPLVSPLIRSSSRRVKEILSYCAPGDATVQTLLHTRNQSGMSPVHDFFYTLQKQITDLVSRNKISTNNLSSYGRMQSYTKLIANNLESLFYLMRVSVYNNVEYTLDALHQESFWVAFPLFTKALLHHSPELACHKDCSGNLPLHVIAKHTFHQLHSAQCSYCNTRISGPHVWFQNNTRSCLECNSHRRHGMNANSSLIEYQGHELIKDILAVNPQAASIKDAEGNLPLHLSLKSQKTWCTGVQELIAAAPFALEVRDGESNMFPFMLAAEGKESDETLNPGQKLTTVYELLRRGPSQIQ